MHVLTYKCATDNAKIKLDADIFYLVLYPKFFNLIYYIIYVHFQRSETAESA